MKLIINKLSYDGEFYELYQSISEYNPIYTFNFHFNSPHTEDDFNFDDIVEDLKSADNIITIVNENQRQTIKIIKLLKCLYDEGNNALVFAMAI